MKAFSGSSSERSAADETAAEFLRAQEVTHPVSIEELRQASESSVAAVEQVLANFDRLQAMKEPREDDESESIESPAYDDWLDASLDLDEAFLEENEGALGARLIELTALDDAAFELRKEEAQKLLRQTGNIALRIHPSVHRLVTLGFVTSRSEAVEKLSEGNLVKQVRVNNVSITPRRRTTIGLLRDLDARFSVEEQTNIWTLEVAPEMPSSVMVSDPFRVGDDDLNTYWGHRIAARREARPSEEATILSISGDKTITVLSALENIRDRAEDEVLRTAAGHVAQWLDGKRIYYQDPDERDFELYHLGMEDPQVLMSVLRSLDVIKHFDPELFFELLGIDASEGGRSMYFGSFLHKALYNTQRNIDASSAELGTMAISTMMRQLFTVDDHVQTYAAVVSQESLRAMAGQVKKSVDAVSTPASKAQMLMMMAVPYSRMAVDAEVRRQLDAFREASSENVVEELRRRIDDIEHPLKLADYLVGLPKHATDDVLVRRQLRRIFSEEQIESGEIRRIVTYKYEFENGMWNPFAIDLPSVIRELYGRIPLIDESREDLGFALRVKVALRDAIGMAVNTEEFITANTSEKTKARKFLKVVMPTDLYWEDYEAIKDRFGPIDRRIAARFSYASRRDSLSYTTIMRSSVTVMRSCEAAFLRFENEADRSFYAGQMFIAAAKEGPVDRFFSIVPFNDLERYRVDLAFLSVIAHPQGKEVAFKYFDKFCEIIPAEKMCEVIKGKSKPCADFRKMFLRAGPESVRTYLQHLRGKVRRVSPWREQLALTEFIEPNGLESLVKINKVLLEGCTPWEIQTGYRSSPPMVLKIDLFDVRQSVVRAFDEAGWEPPATERSLKNPDDDPPTAEMLAEMRSCYSGPETSGGSDSLDTDRLVSLIGSYLEGGKRDSVGAERVLADAIRKKILR